MISEFGAADNQNCFDVSEADECKRAKKSLNAYALKHSSWTIFSLSSRQTTCTSGGQRGLLDLVRYLPTLSLLQQAPCHFCHSLHAIADAFLLPYVFIACDEKINT